MAKYVDIQPVMKSIQQLRGCTCSYSDGIIDDVEMMMDMAPEADVIPIPEGATNEDMVKAIFPNAQVTRVTDTYVYVENIDSHLPLEIFKNWWNAPYKPTESSKNIENEE